jgi:repressor LexA
VPRKDAFLKKEAVFQYIKSQVKINGFPPSVREICQAVGIKSTSTVHAYLEKLKEEGLLEKSPSASRALKVISEVEDISQKVTSVPILGKVAAGTPIFAEENIEGNFAVPNELIGKGADTFILKVKGDSMIEAGILDRDYLVIRRQNTAINNDIVVALMEEEVTVKRFFKEKDYIRLQPENSELNPIIVRNNHIQILGKVIGVIRKM